jgi:hypothetical protein
MRTKFTKVGRLTALLEKRLFFSVPKMGKANISTVFCVPFVTFVVP